MAWPSTTLTSDVTANTDPECQNIHSAVENKAKILCLGWTPMSSSNHAYFKLLMITVEFAGKKSVVSQLTVFWCS